MAGEFESFTACLDELHTHRILYFYQPAPEARANRAADRVMASVSLMRRGVDMAVLPRDIDYVDAFVNVTRDHYGYTPEQFVWFDHVDVTPPAPAPAAAAAEPAGEPSADAPATSTTATAANGVTRGATDAEVKQEIDVAPTSITMADGRVVVIPPNTPQSIRAAFAAMLTLKLDWREWVLMPFKCSADIMAIAEAAGIQVYGDRYDAVVMKDWIHPRPPSAAGGAAVVPPPTVSPEGDIPVPAGYTCTTHEELLEAFDILSSSSELALKPSWTSGGAGIILRVTRQQVDEYVIPPSSPAAAHPHTVVLEEMLTLDRKSNGAILSPVVHCLGRELCGPVTEQLLRDDVAFNGSICPAPDIPAHIHDIAVEYTLRLGRIFNYTWFWGVDYLVQAGKVLLIDINAGRPNGGHTCKMFLHTWAKGKPYKMFKQKVSEALHVSVYARRLAAAGLLFDPLTARGVAILTFTPGKMGRMLAIGKDLMDLAAIEADYTRQEAAFIATT